MEDQLASPLSIVLNRIATGVTCGGLVISIFFSIWALASHSVHPVIGVLIFQLIGLIAGLFLAFKIIFDRCNPKEAESVDFV